MIAYLPAVLAALGLVLYIAADNKPSEVGRLMFLVGLFWFVAKLAGKVVGVG